MYTNTGTWEAAMEELGVMLDTYFKSDAAFVKAQAEEDAQKAHKEAVVDTQTEAPVAESSDIHSIVAGALVNFAELVVGVERLTEVQQERLANHLQQYAELNSLRLNGYDDSWFKQLGQPSVQEAVEEAAQTTANGKPVIVDVTRYYRAKDENGYIISNRGVTVMFTLNYKLMTFDAKWSLCNGDNFSKDDGAHWAKRCKTPIQGTLNPDYNLFHNLMEAIDDILYGTVEPTISSHVEHNLRKVYNELIDVYQSE